MGKTADTRLNLLEPSNLEANAGDDEAPLILITGAAGNIGRKLRQAWGDRYDLILLDRNAGGDPEIVVADIARFDDEWAQLFDDADVVVHLAANPDEFADWGDLVGPNLDGVANVMLAASASGVGRVVFASSNHAMGGYRHQPDVQTISETIPPLPGNPYGATKLMGERLGASLASASGIEFVALRLGWIQRGENLPETLPDDWARKLWLSNGDLIRLFERAVFAELPSSVVIANGLSANQGTLWSLEQARKLLGYEPQDDAFAPKSLD